MTCWTGYVHWKDRLSSRAPRGGIDLAGLKSLALADKVADQFKEGDIGTGEPTGGSAQERAAQGEVARVGIAVDRAVADDVATAHGEVNRDVERDMDRIGAGGVDIDLTLPTTWPPGDSIHQEKTG